MRLGLKLKNIYCVSYLIQYCIELNSISILYWIQSQWLRKYVEFNTQKRIEAEKNDEKDGKALCKLMNNVVYGKKNLKLRNRIDIKLVNNKKDY